VPLALYSPLQNMTEDMGLTAPQQLAISKSYQANMAVIYAEILQRGMHHTDYTPYTHSTP
jgi:hypothetical protein